MRINIFKHAKDNKAIDTITIADFLSGIKQGRWKACADKVRGSVDKEAMKSQKESCPMVTISGIFSERRSSEALFQHSGFISIDIDNFDDKTKLLKDPYIYALSLSISGNGLFALIKINGEKHKESFAWLTNYFYSTYGYVIDPAPSNVVSTRFVSYDPDLYVNESSRESGWIKKQPVKPKTLSVVSTESQVDEAVMECVNRRINIADDYFSYRNLAFAMSSGFGENGRYWFHCLSSMSDKYRESQADKQYDIAIKNPNKGISVGTFYYMMKQVGCAVKHDNQKALQIAVMGKKTGRNKDAIVEQLTTVNKLDKDRAETLVEEAFKRDDLTLNSVAKDPERLIQTLTEWMQQNHPIRRNSITKMIEKNGKEIKKEGLNTIYLQARMCFNTPNVTYDLCERLIFSDLTEEYNPITEYIDKNRHRSIDGNVDLLSKTIRTPTKDAHIFIKKWIVAMIAAYRGFPVRYVLSLVGKQRTGKTEWFRRLLPEKLKKYYAESKLDAGKDDDILMCQKLIVMDDEMGGKSKQDEKRFKELTSKSVFSLRAPYGRYNEDYKRLAILGGTSNDTEIINDPTGNTRILPIQVESVNFEMYNAIDKDELFMECVRLYESGYDWALNEEEYESLNNTSTDFETVSMERELILQFFDNPDMGGFKEWLTTTEIKNHIELHTKQQIKGTKKLGIELKKIFGDAKSVRVNGQSIKKYLVIRLDQNTSPLVRAKQEVEDPPF